ncbi:MAG: hypothetical protein GXY58_18460 [Planctomycetaceae bacterium]|nr:hypothetical protein [Planctomycetaceae bacterium]
MNWEYVVGLALLWIASFAVSIVAITVLLVHLPSTYFLDSHQRELWIDRHRVIRWTGIVLKNLLGLFLVLLGGVLSVPGIPGQGLLTVVIGLVLLDFPGKRRLEQSILSRPGLRVRVNRLRARFGREPLVLDDRV